MKILNKIQSELKVPKRRENKHGKFMYRNMDDIIESVKPLLEKYECSLSVTDELVCLDGRYYICATAKLNTPTGEFASRGYARDPETTGGMLAPQITGAASSYARKYALGGLFLIDSSRDPDEQDNRETDKEPDKTTTPVKTAPVQTVPAKTTKPVSKTTKTTDPVMPPASPKALDELFNILNDVPKEKIEEVMGQIYDFYVVTSLNDLNARDVSDAIIRARFYLDATNIIGVLSEAKQYSILQKMFINYNITNLIELDVKMHDEAIRRLKASKKLYLKQD